MKDVARDNDDRVAIANRRWQSVHQPEASAAATDYMHHLPV